MIIWLELHLSETRAVEKVVAAETATIEECEAYVDSVIEVIRLQGHVV